MYHGGTGPWSSLSLVDEWLVLSGCSSSLSVADGTAPDPRLRRLDPNQKPCTSRSVSPVEASAAFLECVLIPWYLFFDTLVLLSWYFCFDTLVLYLGT